MTSNEPILEAQPSTVPSERPTWQLRALAAVFGAQGLLALAAAGVGVWLAIGADSDERSLLVGLSVAAAGIALAFGAFARAAFESRSWLRGPAITLELLVLVATVSVVSSLPYLMSGMLLVTAMASLVLLFLPRVVRATTSAGRMRGAYPEPEQAPRDE